MKRMSFILFIFLLVGAGCLGAVEQDQNFNDTKTTESADYIRDEVMGEVEDSFEEMTGEDNFQETDHTEDQVMGEVDEDEVEAELQTAVFEMESGNFYFKPENLMVKAGQDVQITFTKNDGTHTFVIDELGINKSLSIGTVISFTAPEIPGRYYYYCDVGAHRQLGMEGVLVVE